MDLPQIRILPDPEEDITLIGVPVGRLWWLGLLAGMPLLFGILMMSIGGGFKAFFIMASISLVLFATFGWDLYVPVLRAWDWYQRKERKGTYVNVADVGTAAVPLASALIQLFKPGSSSDTAAKRATPVVYLVDPPNLVFGVGEGLTFQWADAVRRAIAKGVTVQTLTWLEPDWDPASIEKERRDHRNLDGKLLDLADARWALHRHIAVAGGRKAVHAIRVIPGRDTPAAAMEELARQCGVALGGAGSWEKTEAAKLEQVAQRQADWLGWFGREGEGSEELALAWGGETFRDEVHRIYTPAEAPAADLPGPNDVSDVAEEFVTEEVSDWLSADEGLDEDEEFEPVLVDPESDLHAEAAFQPEHEIEPERNGAPAHALDADDTGDVGDSIPLLEDDFLENELVVVEPAVSDDEMSTELSEDASAQVADQEPDMRNRPQATPVREPATLFVDHAADVLEPELLFDEDLLVAEIPLLDQPFPADEMVPEEPLHPFWDGRATGWSERAVPHDTTAALDNTPPRGQDESHTPVQTRKTGWSERPVETISGRKADSPAEPELEPEPGAGAEAPPKHASYLAQRLAENRAERSTSWSDVTPDVTPDAPPRAPRNRTVSPWSPADDSPGRMPPTMEVRDSGVPSPAAPVSRGRRNPVSSLWPSRTRGKAEEVEPDRADEFAEPMLEAPGRPVIVVYSPTSPGKTAVSAELAAALARGGVSVGLVDMDTKTRALGGRLCLKSRDTTLTNALGARSFDTVPDGFNVWNGVTAYADAPDAPPLENVTNFRLNRLFQRGAPEAEWWIVDLPREGELVGAMLNMATTIVLVADPDWSRVDEIRRAYREWSRAKPVLVVVNKWMNDISGVRHATPSEIVGVDPAVVIPFDPAMYGATVTGLPAAESSATMAAQFDELALHVGRVIVNLQSRNN